MLIFNFRNKNNVKDRHYHWANTMIASGVNKYDMLSIDTQKGRMEVSMADVAADKLYAMEGTRPGARRARLKFVKEFKVMKNKNQYKSVYEDTTALIYEDYKMKRINADELLERINKIPDNRELLKEMSFLKLIVSELDAHHDIHDIHNGAWFSNLVEACRRLYLSHLTVSEDAVDDFTFTDFVKEAISKYPKPKKEYERVKDKKAFWELVAEIQNYLGK